MFMITIYRYRQDSKNRFVYNSLLLLFGREWTEGQVRTLLITNSIVTVNKYWLAPSTRKKSVSKLTKCYA